MSPKMLTFVSSDFTRLYWLSKVDSLVHAQVYKCRIVSISRILSGKVLCRKEQMELCICKSVTLYLKCGSSNVWELRS